MKKPQTDYTHIVGPLLYGDRAMYKKGSLKFLQSLMQSSGWKDLRRLLKQSFLAKLRPYRKRATPDVPNKQRNSTGAGAQAKRKGPFKTIELKDDAPPVAHDALWALQYLWQIQEHLRDRDFDSAMAAAFHVGCLCERIQVRRHEPDAESGHKAKVGGREGSERAYGTPEEKLERKVALYVAVNQLLDKGRKRTVAYRLAGKAATPKVGEKTASRAYKFVNDRREEVKIKNEIVRQTLLLSTPKVVTSAPEVQSLAKPEKTIEERTD